MRRFLFCLGASFFLGSPLHFRKSLGPFVFRKVPQRPFVFRKAPTISPSFLESSPLFSEGSRRVPVIFENRSVNASSTPKWLLAQPREGGKCQFDLEMVDLRPWEPTISGSNWHSLGFFEKCASALDKTGDVGIRIIPATVESDRHFDWDSVLASGENSHLKSN